jgi:hypothetical protein
MIWPIVPVTVAWRSMDLVVSLARNNADIYCLDLDFR